ncbi:unnamed protein product [Blumeria hordei]|uniref:3',5'-cyclic-nucleotide phosphodiesterase n=1 Tax=Blumeria hordei TaxID=2867405 RepID=A0A383UPI2_BLUHO|nr:unnamed protein product [Blumeria hordei]
MASTDDEAALQVIVLGSGGGPLENNTTAFLVRSTAERWSKGSILAVDAGVHLAAIIQILENTSGLGNVDGRNTIGASARESEIGSFKESESSHTSGHLKYTLACGPFQGMEVHHKSVKAVAGYIASVLVETYLITHPHLDHIAGLIVNTAGLLGTRPKRIAGLPSTIDALKEHIFNNVIWPNLSDESNGAGLITYLRLVEGGSPALDNGEGKGFVEVCEGLQVKTWCVSHGHCFEKHDHRGSITGISSISESPHRQVHNNSTTGHSAAESSRRAWRDTTRDRVCVYDSSAHFIRDIATGREILIFGDVEPDSISLWPRNRHVWSEAAPKIVAGKLKGIFIECSYDDTRTVNILFGHLAPRYLIEEMKVLATEVELLRTKEKRKRKRDSVSGAKQIRRKPQSENTETAPSDLKPAENKPNGNSDRPIEGISSLEELPLQDKDSLSDISNWPGDEPPLKSIKVIIIHIKERLEDGPNVADTIYNQLLEHEKQAQLGCEFIISSMGQSLYF